MDSPRARRRSVRRRSPQRLSWLAVYLLVLNLICIGVVGSMWLPQRHTAASVAEAAAGLPARPIVPTGMAQNVLNASPTEAVQPTIFPTEQPTEQPAPSPLATSEPLNAPVVAIAASTPLVGPLQAGPMPILMYHYIRTVDKEADPLGYNLSIAPDMFEKQMQWLHDNGYTPITIATAQRCIQGEPVCPPKAIALTFDDGYLDAYTTALPTLQRFGFTATFYIVNNFVGNGPYMSWQQIKSLHDLGMEIGAHTLDHRDLTKISLDDARHEIIDSKAGIEAQLGITVTSFCYPSGRLNDQVVAIVREAGYANATTTRNDADYSDALLYPRRRILGGESLAGFVGMVQE